MRVEEKETEENIQNGKKEKETDSTENWTSLAQ